MKYASRAIIERGDEILVMKRDKFGQQYYILVGGAVDMGETAEQALIREVKEETGLVVDNFNLVFVEDAGAPYGIQYVYLCKDPGGETSIR
jgi:ADP-ribose pyrophosphatase YjhB (NUDIX family)